MKFGLTDGQYAAVLAGPRRLSIALRILTFAAESTRGVTADECLRALRVSHQSGSSRFNELVGAGLLRRTGVKRRTLEGGLAAVHSVTEGAKFATYLHHLEMLKTRRFRSKDAVRVAQAFLRGWRKAASNTAKRRLITALVRDMIAIGDSRDDS